MSRPDGPAVAVVTRVLPATPDVVLDEWLDDALREWMCPRPARVVGVEIDPTVGGALRLDIDDEGSRSVVTGEFLAIDRPRRLVFTWSDSDWADSDPDSVVTVLLELHGDDATEMRTTIPQEHADDASAISDDGSAGEHTQVTFLRTVTVLVIGLAVWFVPLLLVSA